MATLQQQVQQQLDSTGMSIRDLAKQAGLGKSTVALVASGRSNPSMRTRRKLQAAIRDYKPQTLDATIEQLAVQCIDADLTHVRDTDLECAKCRRVMQLEQQLNDANTAYLSSKSQHERDLQRLNDAQDKLEYMKWLAGEDGRKLQDYQAQISKAEAMILGLNDSNECLQRQLDHSQAQFKSLHDAHNQQVDDDREMLAQIDKLFAERDNTATKHDQQVMRLRVYVWILIAALVLVVVSGLVVWGGV